MLQLMPHAAQDLWTLLVALARVKFRCQPHWMAELPGSDVASTNGIYCLLYVLWHVLNLESFNQSPKGRSGAVSQSSTNCVQSAACLSHLWQPMTAPGTGHERALKDGCLWSYTFRWTGLAGLHVMGYACAYSHHCYDVRLTTHTAA